MLVNLFMLSSYCFAQKTLSPILTQYKITSKNEKKISNLLLNIANEMKHLGLNSQNIRSTEYSEKHTNFLFQIDRKARLRVTISYEEKIEPILDLIKITSGEIESFNREFKLIVAWIPYQNMITIAEEETIVNIKETERGHLRTGSVTSEGDSIHNADDVRNFIGADGTGIAVGVISDGCTNIASSQSTDDLPSSINVIDNSVGGDEGTAMLEIIHDLAPGADLAFSEGFESSTEFINSISDLVSAGCDVIVDDIGYFGEPWFEEGPIATAARNAIENDGIVYASSAGNSNDQHYEGDYLSEGGSYLGLTDVHDFDGNGDWTQQISVGRFTTVAIFLQWSEPFDGATSEYDLHLANSSATNLLGVSRSRPDPNDPYLYIWYSNNRNTIATCNLVIEKVSGTDKRVELAYNWSGSIAVDEYNDLPGSINGQPSVSEVIAAGAVRYSSPETIEYFSSTGPSRIYSYPSYSFVDRSKPDIVAVDGNIITGAGGFGQEYPEGSGEIRFFGTSASAPHAAACAALIWSAYPGLTNTQVKQRILDKATDLGSSGFDYTFGYGRIDVQQACDSPEFLVNGINGGSSALINSSITPGDDFAELTGYTLIADQPPYLSYLDSIRFTLSGSADAADFDNFYLYIDNNGDKVITPVIDDLLGTQSYAPLLHFGNLSYSFTDAGSDIILVADVNSNANPSHFLDVQLQNNTDVEAYFDVYPTTTNFPFDPPDISLPVELIYFTAVLNNDKISLAWETASEINSAYFEIKKINEQDTTTLTKINAAGNSSDVNSYSYIDKSITYGNTVTYSLYLIENNGHRKKLDQATITVSFPEEWELAQNYPNPFNPSTKIKFELPKPESVKIEVYNIIGQKIETLLNQPMPAGYHEIEFNGQNLSSGVYLYKIEAGEWHDVKKMILIR